MNITKKVALYSPLLLLLIFGCQTETKDEKKTTNYAEELHSYAKPNISAIKHLNLDITVDFKTEVISGKATYTIENNNASSIILDSKFLKIDKVEADGKETTFKLGEFNEQLGQPLTIEIKNTTKTIAISYRTTNKTEALQWLTPQQTADKKYPFLFTQGQAILTRTWIPIQDSPQIRITYDATVKVPKELMAVMSAENPKAKTADGVYSFKMKQPISPYLMALAVGDLEYKAVSERTGVYAEKSMIEKAHFEFSDMEKMVIAAENLYGDYDWEQFDVIVLPPSFPFGGMENPRLTFATPTVIAGDKSLTSLIAHELAHSWSGNLVTNATWNDFWLNEGFTVYFEIRIMEAVYGKDRANMIALIGRQDLDEEIESFKDEPYRTKLKLDLKGKNPDDGMNSIAYDKGYLFLRTLEETVGREKFDIFLKDYFKTHAFSTITTEKFLNYLNANLLEPNNVIFNTEAWIYQPGIPTNQAIITSNKFSNVEKTLHNFLENVTIDDTLTKDWTTLEWVHFIRNFPETMTNKDMTRFDEAFDLSSATNSHIAMVWFEQAINLDYHGNNVDQNIEDFLIRVGRRWYVNTLFKAFEKNGKTEEALAIYKKSRANYHSVTANTIDELLNYNQ
ncbi:hydrolase/aminopeptidase [Psychroserpens ponticola]|uniref:Aminopeptidase N n=1 Tax=Psychroserpens ponticola TaxID=2932268 RepID=A0ABY7S4C9_9FLAO|nr:hydrolase/aminopeptidase [Psychroserpens ponticola]WCO02760.1 leukotriene A4 hydrolase C-terminal domain-containing protein [Psychroserpens ponticola]